MGFTMERDNDSLCTPAWILDLVRSMGPIALDPCSNQWSTVGASISFSADKGQDGLADPWHETIANLGAVGSVWVNFPYSKPMPWCKRIAEAARAGEEVFALAKNDPTTRWSAELRSVATAWCHFHKRIRFEGGKHGVGMMASTMFYAGPRPYLFTHVFQEFGDVGVRR